MAFRLYSEAGTADGDIKGEEFKTFPEGEYVVALKSAKDATTKRGGYMVTLAFTPIARFNGASLIREGGGTLRENCVMFVPGKVGQRLNSVGVSIIGRIQAALSGAQDVEELDEEYEIDVEAQYDESGTEFINADRITAAFCEVTTEKLLRMECKATVYHEIYQGETYCKLKYFKALSDADNKIYRDFVHGLEGLGEVVTF